MNEYEIEWPTIAAPHAEKAAETFRGNPILADYVIEKALDGYETVIYVDGVPVKVVVEEVDA